VAVAKLVAEGAVVAVGGSSPGGGGEGEGKDDEDDEEDEDEDCPDVPAQWLAAGTLLARRGEWSALAALTPLLLGGESFATLAALMAW
jgi:hypothetical protein